MATVIEVPSKVEILEEQLAGLMKSGVVTPSDIFHVLNNVFVHGKILEEMGYKFNSSDLKKFYQGLDIAKEVIITICPEQDDDE